MMAPIQNSYDVKISGPGVNCCRCGGRPKRSWDMFLPITRRGTFFQDSFFSNIRHDFDAAVRDVLDRWSDTDLSLTSRCHDADIMGRYRQLRSRNLRDENQAITVASDDTSHKIVLDVNDFADGDVQVKVVGEQELVVEGRVEKRSTASSHSFRRHFTLPQGTDMMAVSSVMSADGILTITAPKLSKDAQQKTIVIPVKVEKNRKSETNESVQVSTEKSSEQRNSEAEEECRCANCLREADESMKEDISVKSKTAKSQISNSSESAGIQTIGTLKSSITDEGSQGSVSSRSERKEESSSTVGRGSWDTFLPISRRGRFFQDSFFSDIHQEFDAAVRDVLKRWNDSDLQLRDRWDDDFRHSEILDRYRQLRSRDLKEENQAVTVASGSSSHKIVLDVHDFMGGDVKVKVVGERDLVVEGCLEKEGNSSVSSHSFRRRFSLPQQTDMTAITSVMSSDGILTITAPEKGRNVQQTTTFIPVEVHQTRNASETQKLSCTEESKSFKEEKEEECKRLHCSENKSSEGNSCREGMKVPITILGSTASTTGSRSEKVEETREKNETRECAVSKETKIETSSAEDDKKQSEATVTSSLKETSRTECGNKFVPITLRGHFFNDSVFEDTRKDFQRAIREVLSKWGEESSTFDDLTCYRNLRSRDLREENQAATSLEDERYHKFVIDVHDFMDGGEINVKAVNDRELVVEGHLEKQAGGSKSSRRFLRRFVVPGDIHLEAVTSVMSSDGVLTISAPKKNPTIAIKEVKVPVSIKENETENQAHLGAKIINVKRENQESSSEENVTAEKQMKCTQSFNESSFSTSSRSSSVDTESLLKDQEKATREHIIPVHTKSSAGASNLEQLDRQHQVALQENEVRNASHKTVSETNVASVSEERDCKRCSESKYLPIIRKGLFADDLFFENVREKYSDAVRDVLEKAHEWSCQRDAMQTYRSLRERNLQVENQAFSVSEDEDSHKVVMDVHDFTSGDVTVSLVGGSELVVEGQAERQEGSEVSKKSFVRRFLLPEVVERDAITSALSSDGILTVISSKKGRCGGVKAATRGFCNDMKSRVESQTDGGHSWEEKTVHESSKESDGCSVRTFATSSRAHHQHSYTKHF